MVTAAWATPSPWSISTAFYIWKLPIGKVNDLETSFQDNLDTAIDSFEEEPIDLTKDAKDEEIESFESEDEDEEFVPEKVRAAPSKKSKENEFKAKKTRTKDTKSYAALKRKAKKEAINYKVELKSQNLESFTFEVRNKVNNKIYVIDFGEKTVTCNCEWFKEIELRRWGTANEVCKHVPIVTVFCHDNFQDNYKGQRFFSTRSAFRNLSEMFQSFDPNRNLEEGKKHANFFLYPTPIPCPVKKYPYFTNKDYAMNYLAKIKAPHWFAEKYNRDNLQGDKPSCKACSTKIDIGKLCIRIDQTIVFQNKNYRKDDFTLKTYPFRICVKRSCFKDINDKIQRGANFLENSNIFCIESIDLSNIFDQDRVALKRNFKDDVMFVNDE